MDATAASNGSPHENSASAANQRWPVTATNFAINDMPKQVGKVLLLFSGPHQRPDNLAAFLEQANVQTTQVDIVNQHLKDQNLLDDAVWSRIRRDLLDGEYAAVFASPPCRTFSEVRHEQPGPPVLRDEDHPFGYARSQAKERGLSEAHLSMLREDNLLAERTAEACDIMVQQQKIFGVEQPHPWQTGFSMFSLPAFQRLLKDGADIVVFDQCPYGARSRKPTQVMYYGADFSKLYAKCCHPSVTQYNEDGSTYKAAHPSVVNKRDAKGNYITTSLAAYPTELNRALAKVLFEALREARKKRSRVDQSRSQSPEAASNKRGRTAQWDDVQGPS